MSSPGDCAVTTNSTSDDLRARIANLSCRKTPSASSRLTDEALAEQLGGRCLADALVVIEETIPFGSTHGGTQIGADLDSSLAFFGHPGGTVAFMDTETTGLSGGTGTVVFLLGLGRIEGCALHMVQYLLTGFKGEAALLAHAQTFMRGVTTFITYNGKSFDHPLIATRYRLARLEDPFADLHHIDLLPPTRCAFRSGWPDCSLRTTEFRLLRLERRNDLPGSQAPQTWFDWIRLGDTRNLPRVIDHNRTDIVSLVALPPALMDAYENPGVSGADLSSTARHYQRGGGEEAAYEYLLANRSHADTNAALALAHLARRRGNWVLAVDIWHELAEHGHVEALERLAKYYEHVQRDIASALTVTERLLTIDQDALGRHTHRARRLQRQK